MKIEEEIRKVLENYSEPIATRTAIYGEKKLSHLAVEVLTRELTELFKSYARELVPEEMEYDENKENYDIVAGCNRFREEILRRIEEG